MVAGHVIGADPTSGLEATEHTSWRYLYRALEDVRMPLFTIISGYVYALRPVRGAPGLPGRGKCRRLVIPIRRRQYGEIVAIDQLCFLQAIFLIFVVVGVLDASKIVLDASKMLSSPRGWRGALSVACATCCRASRVTGMF